VLLVATAESAATWRERLHLAGPVVVLPDAAAPAAARTAGVACAGAAARLLGVVSREALAGAVSEEVAALGAGAVADSADAALAAYDHCAPFAGCVAEGAAPRADALAAPEWIDLPLDPPGTAAPDVFAAATSVAVRTGLWRTMRPVLDADRCHHCTWVCTTACPDGAIARDPSGVPAIDYDHCKGCLVCVAVCPPHALRAVPERDAAGKPS
jgi:pyruvate ferredoxin oxidoreductase gamma subunit